MRIAITGATGFLGRYLVARLAAAGHQCRCWYRPHADRSGLEQIEGIEWIPGELGDPHAPRNLVQNCDAVVHAALHHPGGGFRGGQGDLIEFAEKNIIGTLRLIQTSRAANVARFIFISTCAVHDVILGDRALDEAHPLWPRSHYGAHKAAIEKFVHSFGLGEGYAICSLRPTGIYGLAHPPRASKWFDLVQRVAAGEEVTCARGGKEVHALDVARAVELLLTAPAEKIVGEAFNCYDRYISDYEVAEIARRLSRSAALIKGERTAPKYQIETGKLRVLGMSFGGEALLERTIQQMLDAG